MFDETRADDPAAASAAAAAPAAALRSDPALPAGGGGIFADVPDAVAMRSGKNYVFEEDGPRFCRVARAHPFSCGCCSGARPPPPLVESPHWCLLVKRVSREEGATRSIPCHACGIFRYAHTGSAAHVRTAVQAWRARRPSCGPTTSSASTASAMACTSRSSLWSRSPAPAPPSCAETTGPHAWQFLAKPPS
jgi:hypothetical protein